MDITETRPLIGYLTLFEDNSEGFFIEALFNVDENGYPIDYSYTDKIYVTDAQRLLFGTVMKQYIGVEICGTKLIEEIKHKPSVIIVDDEQLLRLRESIDRPMLAIDRELFSRDRFECFKTHEEYTEDVDSTKRLIEKCMSNFNLTEPFERIKNAIKEFVDVGEKDVT